MASYKLNVERKLYTLALRIQYSHTRLDDLQLYLNFVKLSENYQ